MDELTNERSDERSRDKWAPVKESIAGTRFRGDSGQGNNLISTENKI